MDNTTLLIIIVLIVLLLAAAGTAADAGSKRCTEFGEPLIRAQQLWLMAYTSGSTNSKDVML
jgi:hypothetical protein